MGKGSGVMTSRPAAKILPSFNAVTRSSWKIESQITSSTDVLFFMYMHWNLSLSPCVQPHLVDDPASACVDQYARGLHHVEGFRVEQVVQLGREGAGDQDKVRHLEKLLWVGCIDNGPKMGNFKIERWYIP